MWRQVKAKRLGFIFASIDGKICSLSGLDGWLHITKCIDGIFSERTETFTVKYRWNIPQMNWLYRIEYKQNFLPVYIWIQTLYILYYGEYRWKSCQWLDTYSNRGFTDEIFSSATTCEWINPFEIAFNPFRNRVQPFLIGAVQYYIPTGTIPDEWEEMGSVHSKKKNSHPFNPIPLGGLL